MSSGTGVVSMVIGAGGVWETVGVGGVRGCLVGMEEGAMVVVEPSGRTAGGKGGGRLFWVIRRVRDGWGTVGVVEMSAAL